MSTVEMKAEIPLLLEQVEDNFVEAIHTLLKTHTVVKQEEEVPLIGYDMEGNSLFDSVEEMKVEYRRRVEAMERGEYVTLEELKKESLTWLEKPTT